jgi:hypothetical protein
MPDFESFRQKYAAKAPAAAPAAPSLVVNHDHEAYEAFAAKDKLHRVDLRASDGLSHALPYSHLLLLTYNRRTYGEIFLTISGMAATIRGRNLRPIVDALKLHTCEFIQAYDPLEFDQPGDMAAPFVESVEVEIIKGPASTKKEA